MSRLPATTGSRLLRGSAAVGVVAVLLVAVATAEFDAATGYGDASVLEAIGFAMINVEGPLPAIGFLVPLILLALVLDAALEGAVYLAEKNGGDTE